MRMSKIITAALAITLISATASVAHPANRDFYSGDRIERQIDRQVHKKFHKAAHRAEWRQFRRGGHLYRFDRNEFRRFHRGQRFHFHPRRHAVVYDWHRHGLYRPPHGYHWVRNGNSGDYLLVALTTGVILNLMFGAY